MHYNKAISHLNNLRLEDNICKNGIISHHHFQESLKIDRPTLNAKGRESHINKIQCK